MDQQITLEITHQRESIFSLRNVGRDKTLESVEVPSPYSFRVEGAGDGSLMLQLRWYLETFLEYPFPPRTHQAEAVQKALQDWGKAVFGALFDNRDAGKWMSEWALNIKISSDDPEVLSCPRVYEDLGALRPLRQA